jgi:hypothetical protein
MRIKRPIAAMFVRRLHALVPLQGGTCQSHSLGSVLRNTSTLLKHEAQVALSECMPLCRCVYDGGSSNICDVDKCLLMMNGTLLKKR